MGEITGRRPVSVARWAGRILGSLIGFVGLWGTIHWLEYYPTHQSEITISSILIWVGSVLIFAGCVVGWFKEFTASLLILGGTVLLSAIPLLTPSAFRGAITLSALAILGFLYLYVHLAGKKRSRPGSLDLFP